MYEVHKVKNQLPKQLKTSKQYTCYIEFSPTWHNMYVPKLKMITRNKSICYVPDAGVTYWGHLAHGTTSEMTLLYMNGPRY